MTTITIEQDTENKIIRCKTPMEAMESLAEMHGFKISWEVADEDVTPEDDKIIAENKAMKWEDFDNI